MQALLAAIRGACSPAVWSRGVELSRAGAVFAERQTADEVEVRVSTQGGMVSPLVTLWPEDAEWSCDCNSRDDACMHAAAAIIALNRARLDGTPLPRAEAAAVARLSYRFTNVPGGLSLERYLVHQGGEQRLELTLATLAQGRGPAFVASPTDLTIETMLGSRPRGLLSWQLMRRLLTALIDHADVQVEGKPVKVGEAQPVMHAKITTRPGGGVMIQVEQNPAITQVFANGVVLCGNVLRPIEDPKLGDRELENLRRGQIYAPDEVGRVVTDVLPALRQRIPVDAKGITLPETTKTAPRLVCETRQEGDTLEVLPLLVYGNPPIARIDMGQLKHLGGPVPIRDTIAENRLTRALETDLQLTPGLRARFVGPEAVKFARKLREWNGEVQGDAPKAFQLTQTLTPQLQVADGDFDVTFTTTDTEGRRVQASAQAVLRAWQSGAGMVQLMEGGWAPLPAGWLERHGTRVLDLLLAKEEAAGELPACALPDLARLCDDLDHPKPPRLSQLQAQLDTFKGIPAATLPADLTANLRDYQRRGVDWMTFLRSTGMGAMLADDMGLGKTLQGLCAIRGRTLVVAPRSVLHNWHDEARRFRPGLRCSIYHGPQRRLDANADVVLTTYAIMRLDADMLSQPTWDTVVLDEAQTIKNPDSQVAQAAYRLRAKFRITLTGTPVENRLDELWSQFHFTNRGLLGGRADFQERYAKPIAEAQPGAAARLQERIRPFMLRRLKRDVAPELPPRTDMVLRCTLTTEERSVYDAIRAATMKEVVEKLAAGGSVLAALEALLRLRQAACHSGLVPGQQALTSSKIELLIETLAEAVAEGHKALVFSQWTGLLDLVEGPLHDANIRFNRLDGSTADRASVVREFQQDDGPPVMLVSLKAGGTGLNLTAADHVFLLDPWWNPAVEDQAADRAHRIGQERPVFVHRLVAEETVEERILALQEEKRAIAQAALEGSDRGSALTRDDLLALLS